MKMYYLLFVILFSSTSEIFAQPGNAFSPMTAPGAGGIRDFLHELFWDNPAGVNYNEIFFSSDSNLVINLDPSVLILSGFPNIVNNTINLDIAGLLSRGIKYYWRVVEYDSTGSSPGDIWYFSTRGNYPYMDENFSNGFTNWEIVGPAGFNNWRISPFGFAGGQAPELSLNWSPSFNGASFIMYKTVFETGPYAAFSFKHFFNHSIETSTIGCAYTTDEGVSWTSIWELNPSGNLGPASIMLQLPFEYTLQIGFYFSGNSFNIDGWYIDDVYINSPLSLPTPPTLLKVKADTSNLRVNLSWDAGSSPNPPWGYIIQRKTGAPLNNEEYSPLMTVSPSTLNAYDTTVQLNTIYTYRVSILSGPGPSNTNWSNEATAYVPLVVPVEFVSFTADVINNKINLSWSTASETNNKGFHVERQSSQVNCQWSIMGFVDGAGTTTELCNYSFIDENLLSGKYKYRLKQIDFDGSYKYSNEIEVEITAPEEFVLYQNYPNPFNPVTKIKYTIPNVVNSQWSIVNLKVYDVLGNEIATLVNEEQAPGVYEVDFDAGKFTLASGLYFYRLTAGQFVEARKMVLIR
ncbi:MAG: T9SS type A sorting domain-containing protein [Ignavibacteriaceae bacterium]|nr:T9SS type A sorting domain-containing protein [Ignavibacteriaceae bacterium]